MIYQIYDYINSSGENEFKKWSENLQKEQLGRLNERLDKLKQHGKGLLPEMLSDTSDTKLKKLKIKGKVQLRPLLCYGPVDMDNEFTLLKGAKEVQSRWVPKDAIDKALKNRSEVIADPENRRRPHERI